MNTMIQTTLKTMPLHKQLRFLRKRSRKTQVIVGDLIGMSERTVRAFETAERHPDLATVSMLIETLCIDMQEANLIIDAWEKASDAREFRFEARH